MTHSSSCLCGGVQFTITGTLPDAVACHCTMCRKHTGHFLVSSEIARKNLTITRADDLRWFQSSTKARRGFCGTCGSTLFFDPPHCEWIATAMGAVDGSTGSGIEKHIFVADKGDYYALTDDIPQHFAPPT